MVGGGGRPPSALWSILSGEHLNTKNPTGLAATARFFGFRAYCSDACALSLRTRDSRVEKAKALALLLSDREANSFCTMMASLRLLDTQDRTHGGGSLCRAVRRTRRRATP